MNIVNNDNCKHTKTNNIIDEMLIIVFKGFHVIYIYISFTGNFNEFSREKKLIYPLKSIILQISIKFFFFSFRPVCFLLLNIV